MNDLPSPFDVAATEIAEAYASGDTNAAERLYYDFHVTHLAPDMERWLRWVVFDRAYLDDVYARVLGRILGSLRAGKPIYKRYLATIYRRAAFDVIVRREAKHRANVQQFDDVELLEDILGRAGDGSALGDLAGDVAGSLDHRVLRDAVHSHLANDLNKPKWAELWLHMCEGVTEGPALAKRMGIPKVRARQLKSELSRYLCGVGRHFFNQIDSLSDEGTAV